jgi:hypothetical protein
MSSYSSDSYNAFLEELKTIERSLQSDLKELKINAGTNVNTFNTENSIRKNLESYSSKINKTQEEYTKKAKDIKYTIPEREYNRRVNEINDLRINYERIKIMKQTQQHISFKQYFNPNFMFKGLSATFTREVPGFAIYFSTYEGLKSHFYKDNDISIISYPSEQRLIRRSLLS